MMLTANILPRVHKVRGILILCFLPEILMVRRGGSRGGGGGGGVWGLQPP